MYQVIDRIMVSADLAERYPDGLSEGLWAILAPEETQGIILPTAGQIVAIERPDRTVIQLALDGARVNQSGVVALRFRHLTQEAIPRLSRISW